MEPLVQEGHAEQGADMTDRAIDIETMLRQALAPVEPPAELKVRLETTLGLSLIHI